MKTNYVLLITALSYAVSAYGQGFEFNIISPWKRGVSVTNKAGAEKEFVTQREFLTGAFERSINTFSNALSTPTNHPMQKTLGPLQSPAAMRILQNLSLTVTMLDKDDPLVAPATQELPKFANDPTRPYLARIPYSLLKKATTGKQLEYLGLRAIASIVMDAQIQGISNPEDKEREQHLEFLIYQAVGRHLYLEYHMAWVIAHNPNIGPEVLKAHNEQWLKFIGVGDETEQADAK